MFSFLFTCSHRKVVGMLRFALRPECNKKTTVHESEWREEETTIHLLDRTSCGRLAFVRLLDFIARLRLILV